MTKKNIEIIDELKEKFNHKDCKKMNELFDKELTRHFNKRYILIDMQRKFKQSFVITLQQLENYIETYPIFA
jgi:hypothetical protein